MERGKVIEYINNGSIITMWVEKDDGSVETVHGDWRPMREVVNAFPVGSMVCVDYNDEGSPVIYDPADEGCVQI